MKVVENIFYCFFFKKIILIIYCSWLSDEIKLKFEEYVDNVWWWVLKLSKYIVEFKLKSNII